MSKTAFRTMWTYVPDEDLSYSEEEPVYIPERDENGMLHLVQHGVHNVYNSIQSHADETDLRQLMIRAAASGDYGFLHQVKPVFGDISGIPWDFTEAQNRTLLAKKRFDSLDPKLKKLFKDFDDYRQQVVSGNFGKDVIDYFKSLQPVPAAPSEVKTDE